MAREKIFFCLPDFSGGGAEKVTLTLLSAFAANKNITCVVLNENGPLRIKLPKICELKNLKCMTAKQGLIPLVQLFRSERPDVIFSTLAYFNFVVVAALKISGHWPRRIILREANSPLSTINALPLKWLGKLGYRHLYNCAHSVICNAFHVSSELIDLGVQLERVSVIPNPVDVKRIQSQARKKKRLPKFDDPELPLFVSLGRLSKQKGMDRLIDWVRQMKVRSNLLIIGDGPVLSDLIKKINAYNLQGCVKIINFQKNPFPFMAKADAILMGSRWEGLPNVALEALALGKVVIAARECESLRHLKDVENIPELIVPETSEGFVGELDVIAREVSLGGTRFKISFSSALPEEFNVQKAVSEIRRANFW